jgi:lysophospholipase L1-like esterase
MVLALGFTLASMAPAGGQTAAKFELRQHDHICIIGNQLAERMQYEGWLDTLLHARFPQHDLVIRNLGFSGDEVATRLRSKNFGSPDEWLSGVGEEIGGYKENRFEDTNTKADVIFAFFGYNESYGGDAGLPAFRKQLEDWITHTLAQKYNGKTAPRIVLFSPIAHEDLRNPDLPDGKENNTRLETYTLAMSQVASARGVRFVNLFAPTRSLYTTVKTPLTTDGVHLNEEGNRRVAEIIDRDLFGARPRTYAPTYLTALQRAVADKSFQWFKRYRTTDAFATFGDRAFLTFIKGNPRDVNPSRVKFNPEDKLPTNYEVLEREVEVLDHMTSNRDRQIWRIARGLGPSPAEVKVGDSDTPPFINAGTNEPGKGPNGAAAGRSARRGCCARARPTTPGSRTSRVGRRPPRPPAPRNRARPQGSDPRGPARSRSAWADAHRRRRPSPRSTRPRAPSTRPWPVPHPRRPLPHLPTPPPHRPATRSAGQHRPLSLTCRQT